MRIRVNVSLEHGIVFLYDPYSDIDIPRDTGAAPIIVTETCVCLQVANYVDGESDITLSDLPLAGSLQEDLACKISAPSRHISLTDVPVNYYSILKLRDEFADLRIWNFEEEGAERSWIQIANLDLF